MTRNETQITLISGDFGSGKTEYLLQHVVKLLDGGMSPQDILLVANTAPARDSLRARFAKACSGADGVELLDVREAYLKLLACMGRADVREALSAEWSFILTDLQAAGFSSQELRHAVPRILSRWSRGVSSADEQSEGKGQGEAWLTEEEAALELQASSKGTPSEPGAESQLEAQVEAGIEAQIAIALRRALDEYGLLAPGEAAARAQQLLAQKGVRPYRAVLVDDAQNISAVALEAFASAASDELLLSYDAGCTVLEEGLGNNVASRLKPDRCIELESPLGKALQQAQRATDEALSRSDIRIKAFAQAVRTCDSSVYEALCDTGAIQPDDPSMVLLKWCTPEDEFDGVARIVRHLIDAKDLQPEEVYVAVPNRVWGNALSRALERRWVDVSCAFDDNPLRGNPRKPDACAAIKAYARAALLADENDLMAWRMWCGVGLPDMGLAAWTELKREAESRKLMLLDALYGIATSAEDALSPKLAVLRKRVIEGRAFIDRNAELKGFSLIHAISDGAKDVFGMNEAFLGTENAERLLHVLREAASRGFDDDANHVRVGSYRNILGSSARLVVLTGAMDGFIPSAECLNVEHALHVNDSASCSDHASCEDAALSAQRALFAAAASKAQQILLISTFQKASQQLAERMHLTVRRNKQEQGSMMSMLARSRFIEDAGDAVCSTQSGEQFLSLH